MAEIKLCGCGCGRPAPIARLTNRKLGYVAGQPVRFVRGHVGRLKIKNELDPSMWAIEDRGYRSPCWIWKAGKADRNGYCRTQFRGRRTYVHRAMHEQTIGPIPAGLDVDHLCSQRDCMNPAHIEAVSRSVNITRSWRRKQNG